jgi:hypothetical protein
LIKISLLYLNIETLVVYGDGQISICGGSMRIGPLGMLDRKWPEVTSVTWPEKALPGSGPVRKYVLRMRNRNLRNIFSLFSSIFSISFHNFLPYFQYLSTIQTDNLLINIRNQQLYVLAKQTRNALLKFMVKMNTRNPQLYVLAKQTIF